MARPITASSNIADVILLFESFIDDTLDVATEQDLANIAKDEIEDDRDWEFLKKVDTTKSVVAGDTYLTAKSLPADFRKPSEGGIYVGNDVIPYLQVPFENRDILQDTISHRYYIDFANSNFFILGKPPAGTINFWYIKTTTPVSLTGSLASPGTTVNPVWPFRFWPLIAFKMAMNWYAIDQGDKGRAWDDRWQIYYDKLFSRMVWWNEKLQRSANQTLGESRVDTRYLPLAMDI